MSELHAMRLAGSRIGSPEASFVVAEWRELRAQATQAHNHRTASYLMGTAMLADLLEEAMSQFGLSIEDFEETI